MNQPDLPVVNQPDLPVVNLPVIQPELQDVIQPPPALQREEPEENNIVQLPPPLTPQAGAHPPVLSPAHTPRGRGRGRGRPPLRRQAPELHSPPAPQQFPDHAMPDLERVVRRSERNKNN